MERSSSISVRAPVFVEEMLDLARTGAGSDADDHTSCLLDRDERDVHGGAIGELHRDPVAGLVSLVDERGGEGAPNVRGTHATSCDRRE